MYMYLCRYICTHTHIYIKIYHIYIYKDILHSLLVFSLSLTPKPSLYVPFQQFSSYVDNPLSSTCSIHACVEVEIPLKHGKHTLAMPSKDSNKELNLSNSHGDNDEVMGTAVHKVLFTETQSLMT